MNNLSCSVQNCVNNKNNLCLRSSIKVDGCSATNESETCCASYGNRGQSYENAVSTNMDPVPETDITCDVKNCSYNDGNNRCTASSVSVNGLSATSSRETECSTFQTK
ncbi:MAG: DUF1540 domain-containing protein [Clostridiaceae bacterium]|nr:DUF1540 domain-containing protein [Clostridiaceae bacterium]